MDITMKATRVYGCTDQYGPAPHTPPSGSPFSVTLPNGDRGEVELGQPPQWAYEAQRFMVAVGHITLDAVLRGVETPPASRASRVRELMAELEPAQQAEMDEFRYYTTVVVERELTVPDDTVAAGSLLWWDWRDRREDVAAFERSAKDALDALAVRIALKLQGTMPGKLLIDRTFFTATGRRAFAVPRFSASGADVHVMSLDILEVGGLQATLDAAAATMPAQASAAPLPAHWYLEARAESDPWKQFYWAFFALERLIREAFDHEKLQPGYNAKVVPAVQQVDSTLRGGTLPWQFAVVATVHVPGDAPADVPAFQRLCDVRGDVAHGQLTAVEQLPTAEVIELFERYLRALQGI